MNTFYSDFDQETWERPRKPDPTRSPFQIDRDRILYSAPFRRLQSKTQVFQSGEYDFYRTRLTHSLEVAQIGRGVVQHLNRLEPLGPTHYLDADLIEAVCLAHDLGHPPFGHAGEDALNDCMGAHGGFEGNAQTLRILTRLIFEEPEGHRGMDPTRALLDGVLKYKNFYEGPGHRNKFVYRDQRPVLEFVAGPVPLLEFQAGKSLECQIMDWADDVAYGLMDIVDGVNARFLSVETVEKWMGRRTALPEEQGWADDFFKALRKGNVNAVFARKIGKCIQACSLVPGTASPKTGRQALRLMIRPEVMAEVKFFKNMAVDLIFRTPQIKQLEWKGKRMLKELFNVFADNYALEKPMQLLPYDAHQSISGALDESARLRLVCDYIAGMTDNFASRTYRRLFDPDFGSIGDL